MTWKIRFLKLTAVEMFTDHHAQAKAETPSSIQGILCAVFMKYNADRA